jgi:hypothetical protein
MSKILIVGRPHSGKTTFGTELANLLEASKFATSDPLIHNLALSLEIPETDIRKDKETYREDLIALGNKLCDTDDGIIVKTCLFAHQVSGKENFVVDGVRRTSEFDSVKHLFDHIFYIERDNHSMEDNFELHHLKDEADAIDNVIVIENKGATPAYLVQQARNWAEILK